MDRMIYTAMAGARQVMHRQANNNHNLANVDTTGFKAAIDNLEAMPVYGPGHPSRVHVSDRAVGADLAPGALRTTGDPLHVAVRGAGFIAVQDTDGGEAWTRNGELRVSATGLLETSGGQPVLGEGGPITLSPVREDRDRRRDGTISIRPLGQGTGGLAVLDRIRLVRPDPETVTPQRARAVRQHRGRHRGCARRRGRGRHRAERRARGEQRRSDRGAGEHDRARPSLRDAGEAHEERRGSRHPRRPRC